MHPTRTTIWPRAWRCATRTATNPCCRSAWPRPRPPRPPPPIHTHLHETRGEIESSLAHYKARPLERLRALGIVGPRLIAVHSVHLTEPEIDMLANFGCSVAHC